MLFGQASDSLNLFGQQPTIVAPNHSPSNDGPQLEVCWGSFRQSLGSSVVALLAGPSVKRKFLSGGFFRDCCVEGRVPRRAVMAAALWHIVFLVMPWPQLPASAHKNPALENFQLTWSGPINDLPPIKLSGAGSDPSPRGDVEKPLARQGADAFHPRQRILTDPAQPTHPRQTLINQAAPAVPPKILPSMPNIIQLQPAAAPAQPRMEISEQMLAQLRPREHRVATAKEAPLPDVPSIEGTPAEITLMPSPNAPARPKLELNAGVTPRVAQPRVQSSDAGPAPELNQTHQSSSNADASTLIALSATPRPIVPSTPPPQGNLTARVSISPEGSQLGVPRGNAMSVANTNGGVGSASDNHGGSSAGSGADKNSTPVSSSGGNPTPKSSISGLGGNPRPKMDSPTPRGLITKIDARAKIEDVPGRTSPPNFAALPPGAKPEQVFAAKKVYTLYVNMPNLNSATGSWVLNFSELRATNSGPHITSADLAGPAPLKKSDPKYPPMLINEHVEGEVVLYAVIRSDGSVDSVELVRGLDEQLDANAMEALSQWKFRPASRQGAPVDLEAIVHIPFHAPADR
jgi:TonB family protein